MSAFLVQSQELEHSVAVGPQLHRLLREKIIRGDLPPGSRVSETEFAAAFSVSRQPVREAFIKLAKEDLVAVLPQRGTFVTRISVPAVMTARFIREAVEADIVRRVAQTADASVLAALDAQLSLQRAVRDGAEPSVFMRLDEEFHRMLAEFAGQRNVGDYLEGMKTQMNRVRHISARQFALDKLISQHTAVVDAIRSGNAGAAENGMRVHLREIITDLPDIVRAAPHFFDNAEGIL
jgi:GntR family transcriptional regulator, rspAB operon transcriptional repressor